MSALSCPFLRLPGLSPEKLPLRVTNKDLQLSIHQWSLGRVASIQVMKIVGRQDLEAWANDVQGHAYSRQDVASCTLHSGEAYHIAQEIPNLNKII